MGDKSTFLRQTALITLLAHVRLVRAARRPDRTGRPHLHPRQALRAKILRGQSTFMVEMQETAHILRHASERSLILLDEIGRGTATFDGLSIAWAVSEHLARDAERAPRTLFATLPRTGGPCGRPARGREPARVRARVEGRRRVPAQDRARRLRPLVRHPGRAPRGAARGRRGPRPGDPAQPGAHGVRPRGRQLAALRRRACRRPLQLALFAGPEDEVVRELRGLDLGPTAPADGRRWRCSPNCRSGWAAQGS